MMSVFFGLNLKLKCMYRNEKSQSVNDVSFFRSELKVSNLKGVNLKYQNLSCIGTKSLNYLIMPVYLE